MISKMEHGTGTGRKAVFTLSAMRVAPMVRSRPPKAKFHATFEMAFDGKTWPLTIVGKAQFDDNQRMPTILDFDKLYIKEVEHHQVYAILAAEDLDTYHFRKDIDWCLRLHVFAGYYGTKTSDFSRTFKVFESGFLDHPQRLSRPVNFEIHAVDKTTGDYEVVETIMAPSQTYIDNELVERLQKARLHADLCHVSPTLDKWEMTYRVVANRGGLLYGMSHKLNEWSSYSERGHTLEIGWPCDIYDDDDIVGAAPDADPEAHAIAEVFRQEHEKSATPSFGA